MPPMKYILQKNQSFKQEHYDTRYIILHYFILFSVAIATNYWLDGRSSVPDKGKRFSVFHSFQTGSGAHQASFKMGTGALSPELKRPERETDHSPPSTAEVKYRGAIPPLPITSSWCGA
jgi:hypothetical protein